MRREISCKAAYPSTAPRTARAGRRAAPQRPVGPDVSLPGHAVVSETTVARRARERSWRGCCATPCMYRRASSVFGFVFFGLSACAASGELSSNGPPRRDAGSVRGPTPDAGDVSCEIGETRPCYEGPPESRGMGICREGTETCVLAGEFGAWGDCVGQVTPADTPTGTCECSAENLTAAGADSGVPDTSPRACTGAHSACECLAAGGEWVDIGEPCRICRFDAPSCPAGWAHYEHWNTTETNHACPAIATRLEGSGTDECYFIDIPIVRTSSGQYLLSCERRTDLCCGTPPDNSDGHLTAVGRPWSSHEPDRRSWVQGYNACGCACGPEHCTTATISCDAVIAQIGCV